MSLSSELISHDEKMPTKPRILLVEDYEPGILVASTYLDFNGYEYEVARNGLEAIEKVKSGVAAILMDVNMPGINGFEATQVIRSYEIANNKRRTPIIGMTAHAMAGDRERCIASGMDDYIPKPISEEELVSKLSRFITKK